jgi:hypothetical protein
MTDSDDKDMAIASSIRALSAHARENAWVFIRSNPHLSTTSEAQDHKSAVELVCDAMDALADSALERKVAYPEFNVLRLQLIKLHSFPPNEYLEPVTQAFADAGRLR